MIPLTSTHSSTLSIIVVSPIGRSAFGNPFSVRGSSLANLQKKPPDKSASPEYNEPHPGPTHDMPYPHKITAWKSGTSVLLVTRVVLNRPVLRVLTVVPYMMEEMHDGLFGWGGRAASLLEWMYGCPGTSAENGWNTVD